ncbi:MAG TPA: DUF2807 domain-containing protein [Rhizomicrobium sp.]|jgi:hypothetical protein
MKLVSPALGAVLLSTVLAAPVLAQTTVPVPSFNSVELEGGGRVAVKYGNEQQVRLIKGSTEYTHFTVEQDGQLRIDACNRNCPAHYDLEVEIMTPKIEGLAISGGGAIESVGEFPAPHKLGVAIDGGGTIDARALDAEDVSAAIDGGGMIRVKAEGKLTAAIDGGGLIRYWGNPKVTQAIDGGGEVSRGD